MVPTPGTSTDLSGMVFKASTVRAAISMALTPSQGFEPWASTPVKVILIGAVWLDGLYTRRLAR